jgi:hypothetical protein
MSSHDIDNADDRTTGLLKQALNEEAAMVEPSPGGLQQIQARTAESGASRSSRRRRWMIVTPLGAGLAAAAVIFGVVALNGGSNNGTDGTHAVSPPQQHQGVYDPSAPASDQVTVWYVGSNADSSGSTPRLFPETHTVADAGADLQLAAVRELLTSTPIDPDYRSLWPTGLDVDKITQSSTDGEGIFEFHLVSDGSVPASDYPSGRQQVLAMQELGRAAGLAQGTKMTLFLDGTSDDVLYDMTPDDQVLAWITVDSLVDGQTVSSPVTVQVSGNVFEGNVTWTLLDANGAKVDEGFVTTSMGMWAQAPVDLGALDPGTYTFKAFELSAEDGSVINLDDKTFTVE